MDSQRLEKLKDELVWLNDVMDKIQNNIDKLTEYLDGLKIVASDFLDLKHINFLKSQKIYMERALYFLKEYSVSLSFRIKLL